MSGRSPTDDELLAEQIRYYEERAPIYEQLYFRQGRYTVDDPQLNERWDRETAALEGFVRDLGSHDRVLELACGNGLWTRFLAPNAGSVVAVDTSATMIERNRAWVADRRVHYVRADLFEWQTNARFDLVFAGFFLSHVPPSRWDAFLAKVSGWLTPNGVFAFVDDAGVEGEDDLERRPTEGPAYAFVRHLDDAPFTIVKRFFMPEQLQGLLATAGYEASVASTGSLFLCGSARPVRTTGS